MTRVEHKKLDSTNFWCSQSHLSSKSLHSLCISHGRLIFTDFLSSYVYEQITVSHITSSLFNASSLVLKSKRSCMDEKPFAVFRNVVEFHGPLKTNPATWERGNLHWILQYLTCFFCLLKYCMLSCHNTVCWQILCCRNTVCYVETLFAVGFCILDHVLWLEFLGCIRVLVDLICALFSPNRTQLCTQQWPNSLWTMPPCQPHFRKKISKTTMYISLLGNNAFVS